MIRIIVKDMDLTASIYAAGQPQTVVKSFDIEAPELEAYIREFRAIENDARASKSPLYASREIVGVEILEPTNQKEQ
jgi:hypothetical protein